MIHTRARLGTALAAALLLAANAAAQTQTITSPKQQFGFNIGDDYQLVTYKQMLAYWQKLAKESDRMVLDTIGKSAYGLPHMMAIISSPANIKNLARYKEISRRLSLAEGVTEATPAVAAR